MFRYHFSEGFCFELCINYVTRGTTRALRLRYVTLVEIKDKKKGEGFENRQKVLVFQLKTPIGYKYVAELKKHTA